MKKLISITLCLIFAITLCGCKSRPQTYSSYLSYYELEETSSITQSNTENSSKPQPDKNSSSSKKEKSWESTVIAPYKVVFYKNGQAVESTDTAQNFKIAKHIESYFKGEDKILRCKCSIMDSQIKTIRTNETAIELFFDKPFTFYGGVISEKTRALFIPLTGDKAGDLIQNNDDNNYDYASGPIKYSTKGLEQFFPDGLDAPKTTIKDHQEQNTSSQKYPNNWESTVIAPYKVVFYKGGKSVASTDTEQNLKIARHIESYFNNKNELAQYDWLLDNAFVNNIKKNETAVELFFDKPFTFYGGIIHERTRVLLIPLTGEDKNMIINDDDGNYEDSSGPLLYYAKGLEQFFPTF